MKRIIPGHFLAITWLEALLAGGATYYATRRWVSAISMTLVFLVGTFMVNQSMHIHIHHDLAFPPDTWVERKMQQHALPFVVIGLLVVVTGVWFAFQNPSP